MNASLKEGPGEEDLKTTIAIQKSQRVRPRRRMRTGTEAPTPKKGIKRQETPVDRSQMNRILLSCLVEKTLVTEGNPAASYSFPKSRRRSQK